MLAMRLHSKSAHRVPGPLPGHRRSRCAEGCLLHVLARKVMLLWKSTVGIYTRRYHDPAASMLRLRSLSGLQLRAPRRRQERLQTCRPRRCTVNLHIVCQGRCQHLGVLGVLRVLCSTCWPDKFLFWGINMSCVIFIDFSV
jgi:hypothetical protein